MDNQFIFVAADGDSIGSKVARASLADDVDGLRDVSSKIVAGNELIKDFAVNCGGQVISDGGDEANIRIPVASAEDLEALRTDYAYTVGATLSLGVGTSLSQASKALDVAKLNGKNQILQYTPDVEQQWQQASQQVNAGGAASEEAQKIGEAHMKNDPQVSSKEQLTPKTDVNSPNQDSSDEQVLADAPVDANSAGADAPIDDHSDCPYCNEDAQEELAGDDCPYCAEDDQVEAEAGLDDCPYCQQAHPEDQHQHGDDCPHCQELDASKAQEAAPAVAPQDAQVDPSAAVGAPDPAADPSADPSAVEPELSPAELQTDEHQTPPEVLDQFDAVHGDPSQAKTDIEQVDDTALAEGNDRQENNISRPGDFDGEIPQGSEDPANTDSSAPPYADVMQQDLSDNADDIQKQKVGDIVRQALQSFKATKNYLEMAQQQAPEFYQANIAMIRAMIEMAKLLGFAGAAQGEQPQAELGQEQAQMIGEQPDSANPFPQHPENGGSEDPSAAGGTPADSANPFPQHPENGGAGGKQQGQ